MTENEMQAVTLEDIDLLIHDRKFNELRSHLIEMNEADIADLLDEARPEQALLIFRLLPKETAAEAFTYMDSENKHRLLEALTDKELSSIMNELFIDDTIDLLDEMPANVAKRMLKMSTPADRAEINRILKYPEDSAGSLLTTEYVDLKAGMTVSDAFDYIRNYGPDKETIYTCYITDSLRKLQGVLTVKELLLAKATDLVGDLMETNVISAVTTDDQEEVAAKFAKYDLIALPVVDLENRLVGIITVDDIVDIVQKENTEDIEKMAAILPSDKTYFRTGIVSTFKARIPWLLLLMISATFTGAIISSFEAKLTVFPALIAFIPMLMDTGGNSGSQSSVTIIRSISLGDIDFSDIWRVLFKEVRVGLLCGVTLSAVNFVKLYLVDYLLLHSFDPGLYLPEMLIICSTLLITVIVAKVVGCTLPIIAKKIGFDPAVMASTFITTIVDAISLLVYFGVTMSILE